LEGAWEKPSTYDVEDVEEEPTTSQRSGAQPAATEKLQKLDDIRGKPKTYRGKDSSNYPSLSS